MIGKLELPVAIVGMRPQSTTHTHTQANRDHHGHTEYTTAAHARRQARKCMPERKQPSVRGEQQSTHEDKSTGHARGNRGRTASGRIDEMRSAGRL